MAIRPYIRYVHSSRYIDDLANGEICLAMGWSGDVKQAHDRAVEAGRGIELAYRIPTEGAMRNFDMVAIPADAPHVQNAHLFINFLLRPDIAARNSNYLKYANGDDPALEHLDPAVRNDPGIYPPPDGACEAGAGTGQNCTVHAVVEPHVDPIQDRRVGRNGERTAEHHVHRIRRSRTSPSASMTSWQWMM